MILSGVATSIYFLVAFLLASGKMPSHVMNRGISGINGVTEWK